MSDIELVIFDCDGVLVDSEVIANKVFARVLKEECGLVLSVDDMFKTFVGRSASQCISIVKALLGKEPPPHLEQRYTTEINDALAHSVSAVVGVEQALNDLSIPYCVASSGSHQKMQTTLGKTNLLPYVEGKLFSTSEVERGKPFPDVYLHAAKSMGVNNPSRCIVIEDSPIGVRGGVCAGMRVLGFSERMPKAALIEAGAHHTFDSMHHLAEAISHLS